MSEFYLKIDPFYGECSIKKDDVEIPKTAKVAEFYKSFLKASYNVADDIEEDYNISSAVFSLETSPFEYFFFRDANVEKRNISVLKREFAVGMNLQERLRMASDLQDRYPRNVYNIDINLSMPAGDFELIRQELLNQYPMLEKLGFAIKNNAFPSFCNVIESNFDCRRNGIIPVPGGEFYPLIFRRGSQNAVSWQDGIFIYDLSSADFNQVVLSYIERFIIYPQLANIVKQFNIPTTDKESWHTLMLLDKCSETVIVSAPDVIEQGTSCDVEVRSFLGNQNTQVILESTYRDIIDVVFDPQRNCYMLKALAVGCSEIIAFQKGELTPMFKKTVKVEDYGYATDVKILTNGTIVKNFVLSPGEFVKLSLQYTPENSPKTLDDVARAKWSVSDEQVGSFDSRSGQFIALAPGVTKVAVQLARVRCEVAMVVKSKVLDAAVVLQNPTHPGIQEMRKTDSFQSVEYLRCFVATVLQFKICRYPEKAIRTTATVVASEGLVLTQDADDEHFSISATRIVNNASVTVSLPGTDVVKKIIIDVVPNTSPSANDNKMATFIGGGVGTAVLLLLLVWWCEKFNILILFVGIAAILFDFISLGKIGKLKAAASEKRNTRFLMFVLLLFSAATFSYSIYKTKKAEAEGVEEIGNTYIGGKYIKLSETEKSKYRDLQIVTERPKVVQE